MLKFVLRVRARLKVHRDRGSRKYAPVVSANARSHCSARARLFLRATD